MKEAKVVDINANEIHQLSEVICVKCAHRWLSVRPIDTKLKDLECPECQLNGYVIETGENIEEE